MRRNTMDYRLQLLRARLRSHITLVMLFWLGCLSGLCLSVQTPVYAQQTSATLVGTLTDATGAVVPNARIKCVNLATGAARDATSDGSGKLFATIFTGGRL